MPVLRFDRIPMEPCEEAIPWPTGGVVVNSVFDFIMENVRRSVSLEQYKEVPLPDLVETLEASSSSLSASMAGTLRAGNGTLSDLTSLHRAGDLTLSNKDGVLYVSGPVTLDTLCATFRRYSLEAFFLKKTGNKLAIDVGRNILNIYMTIRLDGLDCDIRLEAMRVSDFSDVSVDISGLSVLNSVGCRLAEWFVTFFNGYIKHIAEDYSRAVVNRAVSDKGLVSRLLGYAISGMVMVRPPEDGDQDTFFECETDCSRGSVKWRK